MRSSAAVSLTLFSLALLVGPMRGEVVQSQGAGGEYWVLRDGSALRVGGPNTAEWSLELPAGAVLHDLEPTATGWLAAGRIPSSHGSELLLIESRGDERSLLEVPARGEATLRGQPVLLLEGEQLTGLLWVEGPAQSEFEIRSAPRQGDTWGATELVSPRGPGSQLSPAAVVLDDGSWLAVWTAFDGSDDEVFWGRRSGGEWTTSKRLHADNDVPDITPDLVVVEDGALAVWSWYDGNDYRLRLARFDRSEWSAVGTLGERGSLSAGFIEAGERVSLLYQTAAPPSWTVLELDRRGRRLRQAVVPSASYERPLLVSDETGPARLYWPESPGRQGSAIEEPLEWQELP